MNRNKIFSNHIWSDNEENVAENQKKYLKFFRNGSFVLDLGCGRGIFLQQLRNAGYDYLGIDLDHEMVNLCHKNGLTNVQQKNIFDFFKDSDEKFDGVFCSHLIEHLTVDEAFLLIKESYRLLNSGGVLVIITPNAESIWTTRYFWLDTTHVRPYPLGLLEEMMKSAGFEILEKGDDKSNLPSGFIRKIVLFLRRVIIGKTLYDFVYNGGAVYIVARKR